jgi:hypothetical protein
MRRLRRPGTPGRARRVPGNALLRRIAGARRETGAIAIVMAVVLVAVLIPLTAFGVRTYVKSGLAGELQRAADAGATAGAALIPLTDPSELRQLIKNGLTIDGPELPVPTGAQELTGDLLDYAGLRGYCTPGDPTQGINDTGDCAVDVAVRTCEQSLQASLSTGFGRSFAKSDYQPGGAGFVHCTAKPATSPLLPDLFDCITNAPDALLSTLGTALPDDGTGSAVGNLLGAVGGLLSGVLGGLLGTGLGAALAGSAPAGLLGALLPSLLTPRIQVTAKWKEREPLDGLDGDGQPHWMSRTGTAKRTFRNLVVIPTANITGLPKVAQVPTSIVSSLLGSLCIHVLFIDTCPDVDEPPVIAKGDTLTVNVNPYVSTYLSNLKGLLADTTSSVFSALNKLGVPSSCTSIYPDASADLFDVLHGAQTGPDVQYVLNRAAKNLEPVMLLVVPKDVTSELQIPFLSFVPACLTPPGGNSIGNNVQATIQDLGNPTANPIGNGVQCTLAAPGLFRGRLVENAPVT